MRLVLDHVPCCNVYLDDDVVYYHTWEEHLANLSVVFTHLAQAISLSVSLRTLLSLTQVKPVDVKVTAVLSFQTPPCWYPPVLFEWSEEREQAFNGAKSLLCSAPVLAAPDFSRPFKLEVDASYVGAGAQFNYSTH